jgi:hypothetical protein
MPGALEADIRAALGQLAGFFDRRARGRAERPAPTLLWMLDHITTSVLCLSDSRVRLAGARALTSARRALFPQESGYARRSQL